MLPNQTVVYKSFDVQDKEINCINGITNLSPPDFPIRKSRAAMQEGKLALDFYLPNTSPGKKPVIAYIHGGGWRGGDKSIFSVNYYGGFPSFLLERGHIVVAISYSKNR